MCAYSKSGTGESNPVYPVPKTGGLPSSSYPRCGTVYRVVTIISDWIVLVKL